jgi:branched-chain amino acid transport system ATP-binding protein
MTDMSRPVVSELSALLCVRDLQGWYGPSHVLHGVSIDVAEGEVVTLLGRNGAGKSTTLKAIMGILSKKTGSIKLSGRELISLAPRNIAGAGIAFCPEERAIFSSLSVYENLMLPPQVKSGGLSVAQILEMFPNLAERLAAQGTKLSGGEQQMLAIGRILRTGAKFLLLDEPTEGLAPVIVQQIGQTIARLKREGFTILLVEQNFHFATSVADRHYVVEQGKIVDQIRNEDVSSNIGKLHAYLGV